MSSTFTNVQVDAIVCQAAAASDAIIANLLDRRGLSHEYATCDPVVQMEIRDKWAALIEEHMRSLVEEIIDEMTKPTVPAQPRDPEERK